MARRRWTLLLSLAFCLAWAAPASAADQTVACPAQDLQEALDQAVDGDVITIVEGSTCTGHFDMPFGQTITLEGAGSGATLDGDSEDQILAGTNVGESVIRNLTFLDGSTSGNGGAIHFDGDHPVTIEGNRFFSNFAHRGGAVAVDEEGEEVNPPDVNDAADGVADVTLRGNVFGAADDQNAAEDRGGAVYVNSPYDVDVSGNTFAANETLGSGGGLYLLTLGGVTLAGNRFEANLASAKGGGATIRPCAAGTVDRNLFLDNHLSQPPEVEIEAFELSEGPRGAGLHLESSFCPVLNALQLPGVQFTQSGNLFDGNVIEDRTDGRAPGGGAGEAVENTAVLSTNDTYLKNVIDNPGAEGGGLSVEGFGAGFEGRNLVAAANVAAGDIEAVSEGGGIYAGADESVQLLLFDSTVVANQAGEGSGIAGNPQDELTLYNSIVHGNTGAPGEISGFDDGGTRDVRFTIACDGGAAHAGASNLCVNPRLANPAQGDVHQTSASPSIDSGNNALVPGDLTADYEGDGRILGARVDRGADEVVPGTPPTSTPGTTPGATPGTTPPRSRARRDRRRPRVSVAGVGQGCTASARLRLPVRINERLRRVVVLLDGKRIASRRKRRFTVTINARRLRPGRHRLRIVAIDRAGNTTRIRRVIARCAQRAPQQAPHFTG